MLPRGRDEMKPRQLGDENTSHELVAACRQSCPGFPMVQSQDCNWFNRMAYFPTNFAPQPAF
jgi:hypothetical protein